MKHYHSNIEHHENSAEFAGLSVNSGIEKPSAINPYLKELRKKKRSVLSVSEFVEGIKNQNIAILSQAVTLIESSNPDHFAMAQEIVEKCLPLVGNSVRVGITGVPGAGKSTFIEAFGLNIIDNGGRLAVLAIDPSSERTKGSILGDKTRMEQLSCRNEAYIRPSPSAGSLGGVARKTRETIILCEAAGFDHIVVETVGVGQSETAVHSMVDFFLLVMIAGAGDELQGIKRGIMEMADGLVINKADGSNIQKAQLAQTQYRGALHLFPPPLSGWIPEVLTCSALNNIGIVEVRDMISRYLSQCRENKFFDKNRIDQSRFWMYESINESLKSGFYNNPKIEEALKIQDGLVKNQKISSFAAAKNMIDLYAQSFISK